MAKQFNQLAYTNLDDFVYGSCPNPVTTKSGMVIGGGMVYPEINFTLPGMDINDVTMPKAAMHEDGNPPPGHHNVRLAGQIGSVEPEPVTHLVKKPANLDFRSGVSLSDTPHYSASHLTGNTAQFNRLLDYDSHNEDE